MSLQDLGARRLVTALVLVAAPPLGAGAQAPRYRVGWGDGVAVAGAGALSVVPRALHLPRGAPPCAPCDPATLPAFDRWAVGLDARGAAVASDVLVVGLAAYGFAASVHGVSAERARGDAAVFLSAVAWTGAATQWLKPLLHRSRPVLYTSGAPLAATDRNSRQSFPSGHAAVAFAAATAYASMARRQHLPHGARNAAVLYAAAAGVGALRVAGGKHFPSDVVAGALLGSGVGWLVATVHPRERP